MAFLGGSAYNMAREIADGFIQVTERTYRAMAAGELNKLAHELDRHTRELRAEPSARDEPAQLQARQRKLLRLRSALGILRAYQQRNRVRA
jgi:hypothetical protein